MSTLQDLSVRTTVSRVAIKKDAFLLLPGFNGDLSQVSSLQNGWRKTVLGGFFIVFDIKSSIWGGGGRGVHLGTGYQRSVSVDSSLQLLLQSDISDSIDIIGK